MAQRSLSLASLTLASVAVPLIAVTTVRADKVYIQQDTYIDSDYYDPANPNATGDPVSATAADNTHTNYGDAEVVKMTENAGSSMYPGDSNTRTLFTLPQSFWNATYVGSTVNVVFSAYNDTALSGHQFLLYPLTQAFVAGTGGVPTNTKMGTPNVTEVTTSPATYAFTPTGADWQSADGNYTLVNGVPVASDPWTTPGGSYYTGTVGDPLPLTVSTEQVAGNNGLYDTFTWNLASILADPTAKADAEEYGFIGIITDETDYVGDEFASLYSANAGNATYTPVGGSPIVTDVNPYVTFSTVPEPASIAMVAVAGLPLLARRRAWRGGK